MRQGRHREDTEDGAIYDPSLAIDNVGSSRLAVSAFAGDRGPRCRAGLPPERDVEERQSVILKNRNDDFPLAWIDR